MSPGITILDRMTDGPLIVQSDKTVLLEVDHDQADAARQAIAPFAELERAPEHVHTYRITPSRLSTPWSPSPGTRYRNRCWWTSSTPWPATDVCSSSNIRRMV
jgi:Helicase conserved C-terminal domain